MRPVVFDSSFVVAAFDPVVVASGAERDAIERLAHIVREELNVRELRFVSEADELGEVEVKPHYRTLGPRFGAQMPTVAAAVAGLDAGRAAATLRFGPNGSAVGRIRMSHASGYDLVSLPQSL